MELSCSVFEESLISNKFKIIERKDPIYNLKSLKNKTEIKNMVNAHIEDGVAFELYWAEFNHDDINRRTSGTNV